MPDLTIPENAGPDSARAQLVADLGPRARALLAELLRLLGVACQLTLRPGGEDIVIHVKIEGEAPGSGLAGEHPPMQEPLAYLLSKMVNRGIAEGDPRAFVKLTFGEALAAQAAPAEDLDPEMIAIGRLLSQQAVRLGKTITVGPMLPRERRSLHLAVKEIGGATTRSEGDGVLRRVLIVPDAKKDASGGA